MQYPTMIGPIVRKLLDSIALEGALHLILIDPDRHDDAAIRRHTRAIAASGADAILVGTSVNLSSSFRSRVAAVREEAGIPVILFPAHAGQVVPEVEAVFFLSLLSGRNPQYLIGEHVCGAPLIRAYGLEPIPVAYLLIESGRTTTVEFMSDTRPIPRDKPEIAVAHSMAGECMGMRFVYLEAGSGAERPVPETMVQAVAEATRIPVIVGGGINTPELAERATRAGAAMIVTGNAVERSSSGTLSAELSAAIHAVGRERLARSRGGERIHA